MSKNKKPMKKGKKIAVSVLAVILAVFVLTFAFVFAKWNQLKKAMVPPVDTMTYDFDADETHSDALADDPEFDRIFEGTADSFKAAIKNWATNGGDVMYSKDVINVLCVGVDTRNQNTVSGLTDSMILLSVNKKLGTLTMTSIMRDSYAYLEAPDKTGSFNKINSAFPFYGVENLISTLQSHFKVRIDGYVMVNFALFKSVIDKMGGVTVPVQQYEADYMNGAYHFSGGDIPVGNAVTLDGEQALAFCRSRKCDADGDVSRTRRQRQVMMALLKQARSIKTEEIDDYITLFLPAVETSYSEAEVFSLATKAVVGGWAGYDLQQLVEPTEEARYGHSGSTWYWAVDYPLAAQTLQKTIYGTTNITLKDDRTTAIDLLLGKGEE